MEEQLGFTSVKYPKGAYIIVEGKDADCFYIIREGKVHISRQLRIVTEEQGDVLGAGDFFGVISVMARYNHIESARALTDVTLVSVRRNQFNQLIQNTASIAIKIILQFSKRMRFLNEVMAMLTSRKNADADASHLFTVGEYYAKQNMYDQAYYAYNQYIRYCPNEKNVQAARKMLAKIAPYVKITKLNYNNNEFTRMYSKNAMIFSEGENGKEFFVIKSGAVKIAKITGRSEILLGILQAGGIFGEMALLESKPRTACAIAYEDCQLMVVNRANFDRMIKTQPQLIMSLTTMLAERVWLTYRRLANTRIADPLGRAYDMMLIHLQRKRVDFKKKAPFFFDFGGRELSEMIGLSSGDGDVMIQKLQKNKHIHITNNKICVDDVIEIARQTAAFKRMQEIERHHKAR